VRKGLPDLLEGFASAQLPDAELLLLGGGGDELEPWLSRQPPAVRRLGHRPQEELVAHYGTAHCFVMASIEEGMAMVQMQALACGLPLICTPHTGGEDLLRLQGPPTRIERLEMGSAAAEADERQSLLEFPAGWVVPLHAPLAIARCLRRLSHEPGLWDSKRQAALGLAREALSWEDYGERAIGLYRRLLDQGEP
jgi:glycosyltransferase involved in cell wall biosynthesis